MKEKIIQEILDILDIRDSENFSDIELFKLLDKKRKSIHPDRTTDETVKSEYEEKSKVLNELYKRFGEYVKVSPSNNNNLQIYKGEIEFDYVTSKLENDNLKEEIKNLEGKIKLAEIKLNEKNEEIRKLNETKVKEETEKLKELFKPKTGNLILLSISAFLSGLILILSPTEKAVAFYTKYLPMIEPNIINYLTFSVLLFVTGIFVFNYLKKIRINKWTEIIKSTDFNIKLFDFVEKNIEPKTSSDYDYLYSSKTYKFKERVIYNFIDSYFKPKNIASSFVRKMIGLNTFSIFENLKKIVIYELINKGIITVQGNSGFDKILKYES